MFLAIVTRYFDVISTSCERVAFLSRFIRSSIYFAVAFTVAFTVAGLCASVLL